MSAHNILQELYGAAETGENLLVDPGDGGTIDMQGKSLGFLSILENTSGTTRELDIGAAHGSILIVTNVGNASVVLWDHLGGEGRYFTLASTGGGVLLIRNKETVGNFAWQGVALTSGDAI